MNFSYKAIVCFLFTSAMLSACAQQSQQAYETMLAGLYSNTVEFIYPASLNKLILDEKKNKIVVLDTRQAKEFTISHLKGAINIDYDDFKPEKLKGISKSSRVVVYCTVGYRSEKIGERLHKMGFTNVQNLYGGIVQWANEGYGLVDGQGQSTPKVHTYSEAWGIWLRKGESVY